MILATAFSGLWKECRGRMSGCRPQASHAPPEKVCAIPMSCSQLSEAFPKENAHHGHDGRAELYTFNAASLDILVTTNSVAVRVCQKIGYKSLQVYQHSGRGSRASKPALQWVLHGSPPLCSILLLLSWQRMAQHGAAMCSIQYTACSGLGPGVSPGAQEKLPGPKAAGPAACAVLSGKESVLSQEIAGYQYAIRHRETWTQKSRSFADVVKAAKCNEPST